MSPTESRACGDKNQEVLTVQRMKSFIGSPHHFGSLRPLLIRRHNPKNFLLSKRFVSQISGMLVLSQRTDWEERKSEDICGDHV